MRRGSPGDYREALALAVDARRRALARARVVRFEVAAARALDGRRPWYSRWYRRARRPEPFEDAVVRGLQADATYADAIDDMVRYLDAALIHARRQGHRGDPALRWLLRQLVLLLRPLMGEKDAMQRVAELVIRRSRGPRGLPSSRNPG